MSNLITATRSIRFPFLTLTVACILLGTGIVIHNGNELDFSLVALALLAALSAHASVNLFNEYLDFKSGLDFITVKTPFSGGTGTLPGHPEASGMVLSLAIMTLLITCAVGLYLTMLRGIPLLALGISGVIIILIYTQWINRWPWICLLAPGLAFGPIMVVGTEIALTGDFSTVGVIGALIPFLVVNNLLLLNQVPDIEADKSVGRKHFPITYGLQHTFNIFRQFNILTGIIIIIGYLAGVFPIFSLAALLPLVVNSGKLSMDNLDNKMKINVLAANGTPALLGLSLLL
jgi:1,4-dihydroxy-2-naphthoate octaprenyltransferase